MKFLTKSLGAASNVYAYALVTIDDGLYKKILAFRRIVRSNDAFSITFMNDTCVQYCSELSLTTRQMDMVDNQGDTPHLSVPNEFSTDPTDTAELIFTEVFMFQDHIQFESLTAEGVEIETCQIDYETLKYFSTMT